MMNLEGYLSEYHHAKCSHDVPLSTAALACHAAPANNIEAKPIDDGIA